jgi:hypothetical protein
MRNEKLPPLISLEFSSFEPLSKLEVFENLA